MNKKELEILKIEEDFRDTFLKEYFMNLIYIVIF